MNATQSYVMDAETDDELAGPFDSRADAQEWARESVPSSIDVYVEERTVVEVVDRSRA